MGISGCVGLIRRHGPAFRESFTLKDTSLIVDINETMYWLVKKHYIGNNNGRRVDLAGMSMVDLGAFFRNKFKRLVERNVKPIIVYSGARVSEKLYGSLAAKCNHLESSSRAAMQRFSRQDFSIQLPNLVMNALKEVINEFGFEVHQSCYESHPVMAQLARKYRCPVMTSHSDFIFTHVPNGFIWTDDMPLINEWPKSPEEPIETFLYYQDRMLDCFKLDPVYSRPLASLYVLLRDDFSVAHYHAINTVLQLNRTPLALGPISRDRKKTRRIIHILENWPKRLTSFEVLYEQITNLPNVSANLRRDFDGIWTSFDTKESLSQMSGEFIKENFAPTDRVEDLNDALTRRECSANFIMNLKQRTNFNRHFVEDITRTYRSIFSLSDRAREYLDAQLSLHQNPRLFDRRRSNLEFRSLAQMNLTREQLKEATREQVFKLFHFEESQLDALADELRKRLHLDEDNGKRLALIILLARYGYRIAFRDSFDNSPPNRSASSHRASHQGHENERSASGSASNKSTIIADAYLQLEFKEKFFVALINSFIYHSKEQHGDTQRQDIPADHRVLRSKLDALQSQSLLLISRNDTNNLQYKHLVEVLNQTLSTYKEVNSLFNFVGPNVLTNKCYDGVLIYRILTKWSNNLREYLLPLSELISETIRT